MDSFADERDLKMPEHDRYTFFVLRHIIGGTRQLLLTDHERLIICFTEHPFPVWIWTPEDASEAEMERAYQILSEYALLNGAYHFNLKYAPAKYFMERAAKDGNMASINLVFTRPEFRRKHYAQNLVYQVTKLAIDAGYVPMLYTDADYTASNACYEKIGYVLRGELCTIGGI